MHAQEVTHTHTLKIIQRRAEDIHTKRERRRKTADGLTLFTSRQDQGRGKKSKRRKENTKRERQKKGEKIT